MASDKIGLIGIRAMNGLVGPNGNHLRWTIPRAAGFPQKEFRIYRKPSGAKPKYRIYFPKSLDDFPAQDHGVTITVNRSRFNDSASSPQVELLFPQPIAFTSIEFSGSGAAIRAYHDRRLVAAETFGSRITDISCSGINRLTIRPNSRQILSVAFITEAEACSHKDWRQIKSLSMPTEVQEVLGRFEYGLRNFYAPNPDFGREKYGPRVEEIILWLGRLMSPTNQFFENPNAPPHRLRIRSSTPGPISGATYLQSVMLMAALDPNIARILSLYWVDTFQPSSDHEAEPPDSNLVYDYKVEGGWWDGDPRCGVLLNLGPPSAGPPLLEKDVIGKQLAGLRWINKQPHGRVGLKWLRPGRGASPQEIAVRPVLYDVTRFYETKEQKIPEPVLANNLAWDESEPRVFVDRDLPLGEYVYYVRPIDLFGQLGQAIRSEPIKVEDFEAPPPPVRTRVKISHNGSSADLRVRFEFGASQHQQAPDITKFFPYIKADTLLTRVRVRVVVMASEPDGLGRFRHRLRLLRTSQTLFSTNETSIPIDELTTFVGDVLTNVVDTGNGSSASDQPQPLPADERDRYRIAEVDDDGNVFLELTANGIVSGSYEIVRDPHNNHTWTKLVSQQVTWREPISGVLGGINEGVRVEVVDKAVVTGRPSPFASVPAEQRGRNFPDVSPPPEVVEVEINRLLTEPEVFAGGTATLSGVSIAVLYAVSNPQAGRTLIALPAGTTVAKGEILTLFSPSESANPPSLLSGKVRSIRIAGAVDQARQDLAGGEIAFEHVVNGEEVTVIMRVISNAIKQGDDLDLVVRADNAPDVATLRVNTGTIRYYAPFELTIPVALSEGGDAPIALPLGPSDGRREGFIALSGTDVRENEGPLSAPVQFSVVRTEPPSPPERPYPCGMSVLAPAGYASPPDRSGRATVCVTWETETEHPVEGVRYEVARALDNSILAAHLRGWQTGKVSRPAALPLLENQSIKGDLSGVTLLEGVIRATFKPDEPIPDASIFRNGRLSDSHNRSCQVTFVRTEKNGQLELLLRGPVDPLPSDGEPMLEAPPDYQSVKNDITILQQMASDVPDAFAMVTGVPIDKNRFTDDVAGKGRNCFFYRVRRVDAAENRSQWSNISAPFHQVDTTPPEAPLFIGALGGEKKATLEWLSDVDVTTYALYRALRESELKNLVQTTPTITIENPQPLVGSSTISTNDESLAALPTGEFYYYRLVAIRRVRNGGGQNDFFEVRSVPSKIVKVAVIDTAPPVPPTDLLAVRIVLPETQSIRLTWTTQAPVDYLIRRRDSEGQMFFAHSDWTEGGTFDPTQNRWQYQHIDETGVETNKTYVYQIRVRNRSGKMAASLESDAS